MAVGLKSKQAPAKSNIGQKAVLKRDKTGRLVADARTTSKAQGKPQVQGRASRQEAPQKAPSKPASGIRCPICKAPFMTEAQLTIHKHKKHPVQQRQAPQASRAPQGKAPSKPQVHARQAAPEKPSKPQIVSADELRKGQHVIVTIGQIGMLEEIEAVVKECYPADRQNAFPSVWLEGIQDKIVTGHFYDAQLKKHRVTLAASNGRVRR